MFWVELVFIFFSACTSVAGIKSQQVSLPAGLAQICASAPEAMWDLTQTLSCSALLIPAHGAFWMSPKKRRHFFCVISRNAKWWYRLSQLQNYLSCFFSVTLCPRHRTKTLLKYWNKEFCYLATTSQGPCWLWQKTLPFYLFAIENSLWWRMLTGLCSLVL